MAFFFFFLNIPFLHLQQNEWNSEKLQEHCSTFTQNWELRSWFGQGQHELAQPQLGLPRQRLETGSNSTPCSSLWHYKTKLQFSFSEAEIICVKIVAPSPGREGTWRGRSSSQLPTGLGLQLESIRIFSRKVWSQPKVSSNVSMGSFQDPNNLGDATEK